MSMPGIKLFQRFDVRPLLQQGGEPLPEILRRVETLQPGSGLLIIAPFLPSPLIELLGSRGFRSRIERGEAASWIIYFWSEKD